MLGCVGDEDQPPHRREQWQVAEGNPFLGQVGKLARDGDGQVHWHFLDREETMKTLDQKSKVSPQKWVKLT